MKSGIELIADERRRQVEVEGWTPEHDAEHCYGQLAKAAACYAVHHTDARVVEGDVDAWPWDEKWDKRDNKDIVRQLSKAGALIAAEIDRIQYQKQNFETVTRQEVEQMIERALKDLMDGEGK